MIEWSIYRDRKVFIGGNVWLQLLYVSVACLKGGARFNISSASINCMDL